MSIHNEFQVCRNKLVERRDQRLKEAEALTNKTDFSESDERRHDEILKQVDDLNFALRELDAYGEKPLGRRSLPYIDSIDGRRGDEFSLVRAVRSIVESGRVEGTERNVSLEIAEHANKQIRSKGFFMPFETRAFNRTSGAGMLTESYGSVIELLRKQSVTGRLGIPFHKELQGKLVLPKQTAGASGSWIEEGSNVSPSNVTTEQITMIPNALCAHVTFSRQLLKQGSPEVETLLVSDLTNAIAEALDDAVLNGSGSGATPTGFLQSPDVEPLELAGANFAWEDALELERAVADENPKGTLRYLTSPTGAKILKKTAKIGTTEPSFIFENGTINGYECVVSTHVPSNFVESPDSDLTALMFGDFADAGAVGFWGRGVELIVDELTRADYNEIRLFAFLDCDFAVRRGNVLKYMLFN